MSDNLEYQTNQPEIPESIIVRTIRVNIENLVQDSGEKVRIRSFKNKLYREFSAITRDEKKKIYDLAKQALENNGYELQGNYWIKPETH